MVLPNTLNVWISGAVAPMESAALARVEGNLTSNLLITGCDVRGAAKLADVATDVTVGEVRAQFNIEQNPAIPALTLGSLVSACSDKPTRGATLPLCA